MSWKLQTLILKNYDFYSCDVILLEKRYDHTVDQQVYIHSLCKILSPNVRQMLDGVIIHHDNPRSHIAMSVTIVFQEHGWEVLNHLLYNPDLRPRDYNLFLKLKELLWAGGGGVRFVLAN